MATSKSKKPLRGARMSDTDTAAPEQVIDPNAAAHINVRERGIVQEMEDSYIDYAMSVIVMRALPDVRDGLKPVHRRILYAMWDIGLKSTAKFRKSATVVGEVLGKYHPHGDTAVYDSMVRLAQDFSLRQPLVNGQGNFGSMDGDSAAAMRYTEAKLTKLAEEALLDIEKNTVDFMPNYDGMHQEPRVLPAKFPNLLLNGTMGIAVGMATSIPPHNLRELCNASIALLDDEETTLEQVMEHVTGPDFPTGGMIYNINDIKHAYATGKGPIVMRGRAEIVEDKTDIFSIIITEIPYLQNKASLVEKIAELVKDKKIEGIKDLRDESDRDGVRVVIELKKGTYPQKILNRLYKLTPLQTNFNVNMLALVDGIQPRVMNIKTMLVEYLKHRELVVERRTRYDLEKAEDRAHILEGLLMALENIDDIIKTIKKSKDREDARNNLQKKFRMTERQAIAILDMRLQSLVNMEQLKVEEELAEKKKLIDELKKILSSKKNIQKVVRTELEEIRDIYGEDRRTEVIKHAVGEFSQEDLIPKEDTVVMITSDGYIKRLPPDTFKKQNRGGKGVVGLTTKEEDSVSEIFQTNTHNDILFFTSKGRVFQLKAYEIPAAISRTTKGQAIVNFLQLGSDETLSATLSISDLATSSYKYLVMATKQGVIKKTDIKSFESVRRSGLIALKIKSGDELLWVQPSTGKDDIMMVTKNGMQIRFAENGVREMGRTAAGVRGMKLKGDDAVVGMGIVSKKDEAVEQLFVVMGNGFGKRTGVTEYKQQGRGGSGVKTAKVTEKTGPIITAIVLKDTDMERDIVMISEKGQVIRQALAGVSVLGRATQGVRLMRFKQDGDLVASVTLL
jgi:DNA gyrase subunit A